MRFNLSEWALRHQSLVVYFMLALAVAGFYSYNRLGQAEDPEFTFKVMVVRVFWPGATAREVEQQVTDRIEKKLQEVPWFDYTRSYSKPGESLVFLVLKDFTPPQDVAGLWYQARKKISDIRHTLPSSAQGPFFNDEFGDTFGTIYAFTSDGYSYAELRDHVEQARKDLLRVADVGKVEMLGDQDERIYVEFSHRKLATLGVDAGQIVNVLRQHNNMVPGGRFETQDDQVFLRITGGFQSAASVGDIGIEAGGRLFRLGDIATVKRGYVDPPSQKFRYRGQDAIGLAVSMTKGGDIIALGKALDQLSVRIKAYLPAGIEMHQVMDQPKVVQRSIQEFMRTLIEALFIVLAVSFISLGLRTGVIVALSIPLTLAITFMIMSIVGIDLQRISLGALIIALGLLVDDAIIAVEMMAIKMEQGMDRIGAASFAFKSTAASMLTGTLITAAGFLPVGLAKSSAGEYTYSIFAVVGIALMVSWVVAVLFIPYLGYKLLPDFSAHQAVPGRASKWLPEKWRRRGRAADAASGGGVVGSSGHGDVYQKPFYRRFRALVTWCVDHRMRVIAITIVVFAASLAGFGLVQQQFFPSANRPELVVDLWLPNGSSITATQTQAERFEKHLAKDPDVADYVAYVGTGSPRFYLPLDQQMAHANLVEFVVTARDAKRRDVLHQRLQRLLDEEFVLTRGRVMPLQNGPPVAYPVMFRVSGPDPGELRRIAKLVADAMRAHPHLINVHLDWNEMAKVIRLRVDQNKARSIGVNAEDLSNGLNAVVSGLSVTQYRERDQLIEVLARGVPAERQRLEELRNFNVPTQSGKWVPLTQVATIEYDFEEPIIWRRTRMPTLTVQADIQGDIQAPVVSTQLEPKLDAIRTALPPAYRLEVGGAVEESAKGQQSVNDVVPLMLIVVTTLLMVHLQSASKAIIVFLTAPLGIIGVTIFLLAFNQPFGFVAMLGTIALSGMIMRNSIILVDQIDQDMKDGLSMRDAIVESTVRRFRPITLTALAAILAMIPLSRSTFWGPMAVAIMGGLLGATLLTLLFLPALYAAWYRVRKPAEPDGARP